MNELVDKLNERVFEISKKHNLSHLGSCFTAMPILVEIFSAMRPCDKFVLSNGHAGLAYYVALEHYFGVNAESLLVRHGIHPERELGSRIFVSTGSLGMGLPIAAGMAYANRDIDVYCMISDGECAEGSIWEALRFIDDESLVNAKVYLNANGVAAYRHVDSLKLISRVEAFLPSIKVRMTDVNSFIKFPTELSAHYTSAIKINR